MGFELGELVYHTAFRNMGVITSEVKTPYDVSRPLYNPLIKFKTFLQCYSARYVRKTLANITKKDIDEIYSSQLITYL